LSQLYFPAKTFSDGSIIPPRRLTNGLSIG
jgi:hypothetical protein